MYDVIVIGAGPTGCSASKELSSKGYKVLLVEKKTLPREKSCSGVLIKKSMNLVEKYFNESVPLHTQCKPTDNHGMIFTNSNGVEYKFEQPGLNIWRDKFDFWLTQKAVEAGTELRQSTAATSCIEKDNYVEVILNDGKRYTEKAQIVLACDGAVSSIKRNLLGTPKDYVVTFQTFCNGTIELDQHYFYAYLQSELSEYDAWFNVKDDYLIFGVAVRDTNKIQHYYTRFIEYMTEQHNLKIENTVKAERWIMPDVMPECNIDYGKGRVMFAGETAGFLNPMGEGISCGMECGFEAAQTIQEIDLTSSFDADRLYSTYKEKTESLHNYMIRQWQFVERMNKEL